MIKLKKNSAECRLCGSILVSTHRSEQITCSCKNLTISGGLDFTQYTIQEKGSYISLNEWETVEKKEVKSV